jgi:hypothetical protein
MGRLEAMRPLFDILAEMVESPEYAHWNTDQGESMQRLRRGGSPLPRQVLAGTSSHIH